MAAKVVEEEDTNVYIGDGKNIESAKDLFTGSRTKKFKILDSKSFPSECFCNYGNDFVILGDKDGNIIFYNFIK